MNNTVVLFLTSPSSWNRSQMCLSNFKQLEKLGFDIITLTTSDGLPKYIYEKSKMVIHDYNEHKCQKKHYYNYYKNTEGSGYFFWGSNENHSTVFFHETHFPSLLRNTRTLIEISKSFGYEKYFYIEDDHHIDDKDFQIIYDDLKLLDENDLVVYKFNKYTSSEEYVYCSYLHFGKCNTMQNIVNNFKYTETEFVNSDPSIFMHFYESILTRLIQNYKNENFKLVEHIELIVNKFKNSKINMVYSYNNILDESRCNVIFDVNQNKNVFYCSSSGVTTEFNLKLVIDDSIIVDRTIYPGTWFYIGINDTDINNMKVVINNTDVKSFKNLNIKDIIYNGELRY